MTSNFWFQLDKPILALAPMFDVTDSAFRQTIIKHGQPSVVFTWFVSVEGLMSQGKKNILSDLDFDKSEHPIIAQVFGRTPDAFFQSAKIIKKMGFDGIDINFGCPEKKALKQNTCAALIEEPELAKEIILATKRGASNLPVSIKTRLGLNNNIIDKWLPVILETQPAAITLHGRTAKEMSKVPNDWEEVGRIAKIVKKTNPNIIFLGNGDIKDRADALAKTKQYNLDGVMVGRGIFGNPWFFNPDIKKSDLSLSEVASVLLEHTLLFAELYPHKNFSIMKKHFSSYLSGFPDIKSIRVKLMATNNASEVETILKPLIDNQ